LQQAMIHTQVGYWQPGGDVAGLGQLRPGGVTGSQRFLRTSLTRGDLRVGQGSRFFDGIGEAFVGLAAWRAPR